MVSVIPILNSYLISATPQLHERILFQIEELGHDVLFVDDSNATKLIHHGNPLITKVPFIILIKDPANLSFHEPLAKAISNRFSTAISVSTSIPEIGDLLLSIDDNGGSLWPRRTNSSLLRKAIKMIYANLDNTLLGVEWIVKDSGVSKEKLEKEFLQHFGQSIWQTAISIRLKEAKRLLEESNAKISEIGTAVGINEPSAFSKIFVSKNGLTPREYRKRKIDHQNNKTNI